MSITTKTGDGGQTDLLGGQRASKSDPRVACCGVADELCAALGLARSLSKQEYVRSRIEAIQKALFTLGYELAGGDPDRGLTPADVTYLEEVIDQAMTGAGEWTGFALPGADPASAALHLARTVARRLEREVVSACEDGVSYRPLLLSYVNRLSDALFALARREEQG